MKTAAWGALYARAKSHPWQRDPTSRVRDAGRELMRRLFVGVLVAAAVPIATTGCGPTSGAASRPGSLNKVATACVDVQARTMPRTVEGVPHPEGPPRPPDIKAAHPGKLTAHEFAQARTATLHDVALRKRTSERVAAVCAKRK